MSNFFPLEDKSSLLFHTSKNKQKQTKTCLVVILIKSKTEISYLQQQYWDSLLW